MPQPLRFRKQQLKKFSTSTKLSNDVNTLEIAGKKWFAKSLTDDLSQKEKRALVEREVTVQELSRMISPNYPEYQVGVDEENNVYVMSKNIENATAIQTELTLRPYDFVDKCVTGEYRNLGEAMVIALWLGDRDFKPSDLLLDKDGLIGKIDGGSALSDAFRPANAKDIAIKPGAIAKLPDNPFENTDNWVDKIREKSPTGHGPVAGSLELRNNEIFRAEVNAALLKIILLPERLIDEGIEHHSSQPDEAKKTRKIVFAKKQQIKNEAALDPSFQQYLTSPAAEKMLDNLEKQLSQFQLSEKNPLVNAAETENIHEQIHEQFTELKTEALFSHLLNLYENQLTEMDNTTLLKIALLPQDLVRKYVDFSTSDPTQREKIYQHIIHRQQQLKNNALTDAEFQKYMLGPLAASDLHVFKKHLLAITSSENAPLIPRNLSAMQEFNGSMNYDFENLQSNMRFAQAEVRRKDQQERNKEQLVSTVEQQKLAEQGKKDSEIRQAKMVQVQYKEFLKVYEEIMGITKHTLDEQIKRIEIKAVKNIQKKGMGWKIKHKNIEKELKQLQHIRNYINVSSPVYLNDLKSLKEGKMLAPETIMQNMADAKRTLIACQGLIDERLHSQKNRIEKIGYAIFGKAAKLFHTRKSLIELHGLFNKKLAEADQVAHRTEKEQTAVNDEVVPHTKLRA